MSSEFGNRLKIQIFGASHGKAVGVVADGLPAGESVDEEELYRFMCRRRPGASPLATARSEKDRPVFLSGLVHAYKLLVNADGARAGRKSENERTVFPVAVGPNIAIKL